MSNLAKKVADASRKETRMTPKGKGSAGKSTSGKASSENMVRHKPRTQERGAGSGYAYAVAGALDDSKKMKGSTSSSFLGKSKKSMDPTKHNDPMLYKGKGK